MFTLNDNEKIDLKKSLKHYCISVLEKRIAVAQEAMKDAQEAANSEGKSSAGDKYETSRAMGQLDRDMNAKQLEEANRDLAFINALDVNTLSGSAHTGSVIVCEHKTFFIGLGLGIANLDGKEVILLSPNSPIACLLTGKKSGDTFNFNGNETGILGVF